MVPYGTARNRLPHEVALPDSPFARGARPRTARWPAPVPEPPPRSSWRPRLSFAGVVSSILALAALLGFIRIEPQHAAPAGRRSTMGKPDPRLPPPALLEP